MNEIPLMDILIFGMIAVFVGLRLYSVLGQKTGREVDPGPDPFLKDPNRPPLGGPDPGAPGNNVMPFPGRGQPAEEFHSITVAPREPSDPPQGPSAAVIEGVAAVRRVDPGFSPEQFIAGAGYAYEMIVGAFAVGDKATLKTLLDPAVFEGFAASIDERAAAGRTQESRFVNVRGAEIREVNLRGTTAEITVRFSSDMIIVTRDPEGRVVSGSPTVPREVIDLWTFSRNMRSPDPNWLLIATGGAV